ncbi:MAG: ABC transporter substrate-binding protein [Actinomycetota bacterium]
MSSSACGARWSADQDGRAGLVGRPVHREARATETSPAEPGDAVAAGATSPADSGPASTASLGHAPSGATRTSTGSSGVGGRIDPGPHPGVTDTQITLCVLMPETGASPLPTTWEKGVNLYWDYLKKKGGVHGRNVKLIIKDTKSDTAEALARARDCIHEKAFSFYTMDRVEVVAALGKFLNDEGIPHMLAFGPATPAMDPGSAQVNTFVISIDHRIQGRLVADYFTTGDLSAKRPAIVRENVPDAVPFAEAFKARLREKGKDVVAEDAIDGQANDYSQTVFKLRQANAELVVTYVAPTPMIKLAQQAQAVGYHPIWFADAPSWNFDMVLALANANGALKGARAFSPWVALSSAAANTYKTTYRQMYPNETPDDIGLIGWGLGEVMHAALQAAGPNLGYKTFRAGFQSLKAVLETWGPVDFTPNRRVGSDVVIEFRESGDHWNQMGTFRRSF